MRKKLTLSECIQYITRNIRKIGSNTYVPKIVKESVQEQEESIVPEPTEELLQKANTPMIYAFITPQIQNAIKVGYTDQGVQKRINQWKSKYEDVTLVGYWTSREFDKAGQYVFFKDWPVHDKIISRGYDRLSEEAFKVDEVKTLHVSREFFNKLSNTDSTELSNEVLKTILDEMKQEIKNGTASFGTYKLNQDGTVSGEKADNVITDPPNTYIPTPLQAIAIDKATTAIQYGKKDLLMAAVMRFGKTFTTYKIVQENGLRKVLVCSAKTDVKAAWWNDINHRDFIDRFVFIDFDGINVGISEKSQKDGLIHRTLYQQTTNLIEAKYKQGKTVIVFASLQDLSGSNQNIKEKHKYLFETEFDMLVVDETHYGSHGQSQGQAIGLNGQEDYSDIREEEKTHSELSSQVNKIKKNITLQCSGTPYYILASGEFSKEYENKEIISDVSYSDMLEARDKWVEEHRGQDESKSPYFGIPNIYKFGMCLTPDCHKAIAKSDVSVKMSVLFAVDERTGKFVNEKAIRQLIEYIYGDPKKSKVGFLDVNKVKEGEIFKHTIIVLPRIKACNRMRDLLKSMDLDRREVICAVNENNWYEDAAKDPNTLKKKLEDLERNGKRSIILTVNRFLTGVSLPLVDSMMFMKDTKSPQEYDQAIFRLCTRNIGTAVNDKGERIKVNRKSNVFLLDFNIDRMFEMVIQSSVAQANSREGSNIDDIQKLIEKNLKTIPVYSNSVYNNQGDEIIGKMHQMNPKDLMKTYVNYNKDRSIGKSVEENIGNFDFIHNIENLKLVGMFRGGMNSVGKDSFKDIINNIGQDSIDLSNIHISYAEASPKQNPEQKTKKGKEEIVQERILRDSFASCVKNVLYCNLVLDRPASSLREFINALKNGEQDKAYGFNLSEDYLEAISKRLSRGDLSRIDMMLYRVAYQSNDKNIENEVDRFKKAVEDLGKIDKSEVVTPEAIVDKMISKLSDEDFKNANSILLVNEKCGEFLGGIYKNYGADVASKCKIISSSNMTKYFVDKIVKTYGLGKDIILDIQDSNNDNKLYDDFLNMPNEDIEKMNGGKKFDICLMNPPYDHGLHIKFLQKINKISEKYVSIQPISFLQRLFLYENKEKNNGIHCDSIEVISLDKASKIFNIDIKNDLGIISKISDTDNLNFSGLFDKDDLDMISKCLSYVKNTDQLSIHLDNSPIENKYSLKFTDGASLYSHGKMLPTTFRVCAYNYNMACSREKTGHVKYLNVETSDKVRKNIWDFYNSVYMRWWIFKCCLAETRYKYVPYLEERRFIKPWEIKDYEEFFINEIKFSKDQWKEYKSKAENLPI